MAYRRGIYLQLLKLGYTHKVVRQQGLVSEERTEGLTMEEHTVVNKLDCGELQVFNSNSF